MTRMIPAFALGLGLMLTAPVAFAAPDKEDAQALRSASVSLTQAIETAEKQGKGKALEAEFDTENGAGRYEIKVLAGQTVTEYAIDARSGQVVGSEQQTLESWAKDLGLGADASSLNTARTTLSQAIGVAEQRAGGKAYEVDVESNDGAIQYEVSVLKGDQAQTVRVDGNNGTVVSASR